MTHRVWNFNAGPATLPVEVLEEAREGLFNYKHTGMGVMELSHRSKPYEEIHYGLMKELRALLGVGDEWQVLLLGGGASLQFSMVAMNLLKTKAAYVLTGEWAQKAAQEAKRHGEVIVAASSEGEKFGRVPALAELQVPAGCDYLHITSNNTIYGTQWHHELPQAGAPLIVDMSSDFLSRPVAMDRIAMIYAGAQKNLGPSGVTVVLMRKEMVEQCAKGLPTMLSYRTHADKDSLYNTPPTWPIWISLLCTQWLQRQGGLAGIAKRNQEKADLLYGALDADDFFRPTADKASRSQMNVTFRLADEAQEERFAKEATAAGLVGLKGHRAVGGLRASIYNAMPVAGVQALVDFMRVFAKKA
jgi:phosphoserine aminotransferase